MVVVVHTQVMYLAVVIMGLYVAFLLDSRVGGGIVFFIEGAKKKGAMMIKHDFFRVYKQ